MQIFKRKKSKFKIMNALIASVLIVTLVGADFFLVGKEVIAASTDLILNKQTENTINKNVKFDTFFIKDNEKNHYLICDVNSESQDMYINLSVQEGYLKNAKIEFKDNNYKIEQLIAEDGIIRRSFK